MWYEVYKLTEAPNWSILSRVESTFCGSYVWRGSPQWSNHPSQNSVTKSGPLRVIRLRSPSICSGLLTKAPKFTVRRTSSSVSLRIAKRLTGRERERDKVNKTSQYKVSVVIFCTCWSQKGSSRFRSRGRVASEFSCKSCRTHSCRIRSQSAWQ